MRKTGGIPLPKKRAKSPPSEKTCHDHRQNPRCYYPAYNDAHRNNNIALGAAVASSVR